MSDVESAKYWLSWLHTGSKIAVLLVVIGVAYEFVEKRFGEPLQKVIDSAKDEQVAQLTRESNAARVEIARLGNATADANARAKEAEARAAEANKVAEQERLARFKLEASMADRRLTQEQKHRIHDVLSASPAYAVVVVSRLNDTEAKIYGSDFVDAFKASNWKAQWDVDWLRDTEIVSIATVNGVKGPEVALLDAALTAANIAHGFTPIDSTDLHAIEGAGFRLGMTYVLIGRHKP